MEAVRAYETLADLHQDTRHYGPAASHLCTHRRQNLTSYDKLFDVEI
jgi:hypothetical protein